MPKKSKKKAGKKSTKKAAVKKTAKRKVTKKAASRPAKKKPAARSAVRTAGPKGGPTLRQPGICAQTFNANNQDPVQFQNIPSGTTVTLIQGLPTAQYPYPFSPVTGTDNQGRKYTNLTTGGQVTVATTNLQQQTFYYDVSNAGCTNEAPGHSVVVNP
ncbi:MAG TPA: hypothetical protein VGG14_14685 [Candidatus Sulfotelmatobacter sp.]|jgi:hypothetical protein